MKSFSLIEKSTNVLISNAVSFSQKHEEMKVPIALWGAAFFGVAIAIAVVVAYRKSNERANGYQSILV